MREDDGQRSLSEIGRFTRHVRAGDQQEPRAGLVFAAEVQIICGETLALLLERRLDDGVAQARCLERRIIGQDWADRVCFEGPFGRSRRDIQVGNGSSGAGQRRIQRIDPLTEIIENCQLAGLGFILGAGNLSGQF